MLILTPDEVMERGLDMMGHGKRKVNRPEKLRLFRAAFAVNPVDLAGLWEEIQQTPIVAAKVNNASNEDLANFLWCVHWLNVYDTEPNLAGKTGTSDTTVRKNNWLFANKLQAMLPQRVVWPEEWMEPNTNDTPIFLVSVDGIHCRVFEPQNGTYSKNPKYYSHKFNQSALCYEVAISVFDNQVVWVNGPFRGGKGDREIFRKPEEGDDDEPDLNRKALQEMIVDGKKVIADAAYQAKDLTMITTVRDGHSKETAKFISRAKVRQEHFNAKLKNFNILSETFRHGIHKHQTCFEACLVLCTYQIERSAPLFDV
jgi:hypothetical protein